MKPFNFLRVKKPKSNIFDLSHERKFTGTFGKLMPIYLEEVLPGDRFKINHEHLIRLAPLIAPIFHRINVYTHFFHVPYRLIWQSSEKFFTAGEDGDTVIPMPMYTNDNGSTWEGVFASESLGDYFGIHNGGTYNSGIAISQLPFRAYRKIWNDYYRDQNLQDELEIETDSTSRAITWVDTNNRADILYRNWEKDYFTSALPWAQRGTPVTIPFDYSHGTYGDLSKDQVARFYASNTIAASKSVGTGAGGQLDSDNHANAIYIDADVNITNESTISDLRAAFALQRWMEKNARGGVRYTEWLLHHFGVKSPDMRLQRAEFLGGGKVPVQISQVMQTAPTYEESEESALGNFAGQGHSAGQTSYIEGSFTEHGLIIGLMSIMPKTGYYGGIPRLFFKSNRFDFYTPDFAHIGEQAITVGELWSDGPGYSGEFGYIPRYEEYRQRYNTVHGLFKTDYDFWHMDRGFYNLPALNETFVKCDPTDRIWAINWPDQGRFFINSYLDIKAIRPVSKLGEPY